MRFIKRRLIDVSYTRTGRRVAAMLDRKRFKNMTNRRCVVHDSLFPSFLRYDTHPYSIQIYLHPDIKYSSHLRELVNEKLIT